MTFTFKYDMIMENIYYEVNGMKLKNITVQVGGFHDHWLRNGTDTPGVLIAAVNQYHYDFICLMDGEFPDRAKIIKRQMEKWIPGFKVHLGEERAYGWGHVVSVMNDCKDIDLENVDFKEEFSKMQKAGGIAALAHIAYPLSKEKIIEAGKLDELIDSGYVDAVQIQTEEDWKYIEKRAESGKKLPLISGWDSHMLINSPGMPNCLYSADFRMEKHFDHSSTFRTVVFAEDNSLESIKAALREGKSVLEDAISGKMFGSPELIELLKENGFSEKIRELDNEYNALNIECEPLRANSAATLKFPQGGRAAYAKNSNLDMEFTETADGNITVGNIPMPAEKDESYLPFMFDNGRFKRYWAVKVENDIRLKTTVMLKNGKRILSVYTYEDFDGKLIFEKPCRGEFAVSAKKNSVLFEFSVPESTDRIFDYSFSAEKGTSKRSYASHAALVKAHRYDGGWDKAETLKIDNARFSGGFGASRPYPGRDVFSADVRLLWDDDNLYLRYDVTDKIYVSPPEGRMMYLSDITTFNIDALCERTHFRDSGCELLLGFPDGEGEIFCTHTPVSPDGKGYFDREDNCPIDGEMKMEKTERGRIVTVKIPWREISPKAVAAGDHMGITVGAVNDEGEGPVDNIQWPWPPAKGAWLFPDDWGIMVLVK